jgi:cytochrome c553
MKKVLKWIGIILGGLVGLLVLAGVVLYILGSVRLNKTHDIQAETIAIPSDDVALARGEHLVEAVTFCKECHGENLGGDIFDDEPGIATISASNLTSGQGGVGAIYSDADWVRAIRHGVNPEGRGLLIMHSDLYHNLSEQDLGSIIAYVKSVPPVDNELPETEAKTLGKVLVALGVFDTEAIPLIPAEKIDHSAPFAKMPNQGPTAEYGGYLMSITLCRMCHGSDLTGGVPLEEGMPPGPDITPDGRLSGVSEQAFIDLFRTRGMTESEVMPWDVYNEMTDDELKALWMYLQSLPPQE